MPPHMHCVFHFLWFGVSSCSSFSSRSGQDSSVCAGAEEPPTGWIRWVQTHQTEAVSHAFALYFRSFARASGHQYFVLFISK